jgi:hypothetical protein
VTYHSLNRNSLATGVTRAMETARMIRSKVESRIFITEALLCADLTNTVVDNYSE